MALLLAVPALTERMLLPRADAGLLPILNIVLSFVFDVFVVVVIFRRVFTKEQPNSETVFGALCIYLLVGFTVTALTLRMSVRSTPAMRCNSLGNATLQTFESSTRLLHVIFRGLTCGGHLHLCDVN